MDLDRSADRLRAAMAVVQQAADDADTARDSSEGDVPGLDFDQIEGWLAEQAPAGQTPAADRPEPRQRMRQLVQEQRRDGIGPTAVHQVLQAEGYPTFRQTIITWMRADAAAGILAQPGGKGQPYVPGPRFSLDT